MTKMRTALCTMSVLLLAACGSGGNNVKEELGLKTPAPDEFSVVTRAPLEVPPDFTLRPPRPGAERPNEIAVRDQAKKTVFGVSDSKPVADPASKGEGAFLGKLGANAADPSIRTSIDTDVQTLEKKEQPVAEKLLFWKKKAPLGKSIDPAEEKKRLDAQKAAASGNATSSDTTIEKRNEDILKAQ